MSQTPAPLLRFIDQALITEVDGQAVLLDMRTERYFSLDGSGADILAVLREQHDWAHALDMLVAVFEVDREALDADIRALVESLQAADLIDPTSGVLNGAYETTRGGSLD